MLIPPIPIAMLPHSAELTEPEKTEWGGIKGMHHKAFLKHVRFCPVKSVKMSLSGDIPDCTAKLIYDCVNSQPKNVVFKVGDRIIRCGNEYTVVSVKPCYADKAYPHHMEVILK